MPRRRLPPLTLRAPSVRLERVDGGAERPNPDWIQVAAEGEFRGYRSGAQPFTLDEATFGVIIRNFHNHPSYVAAGGPTDVVAFDFSHASEGDPAAIAVEGAPAQAWAQELEIRRGSQGVELWALTRFLEPMLTYRAQGKYKWTSVCVWPDAIDPRSGEKVGWSLSSIAFTNDPFIQGMVPLAASMRGFDPFCPPSTPNEVLEALRGLFELGAMAPVDEVIGSLAKLRSYTSGTPAPAGVEVDELVGCLRQIFNLPTLSSADEVFAQADALLVALAGGGSGTTIAADRKDDAQMNRFEKACIALAARLKVKLSNREDEDVDVILLEATDAAVEKAGSGTKKADEDLGAMLAALGEQDVPGAMKRIADMIAQSARLKAVLPSLEAYEKQLEADDAKQVEEDVAMAMTHHCHGAEAAKAALLHMRRPPKDATPEQRRAAREAFLTTYPAPTAETLALTSRLTATAGGKAVAASTGGTSHMPKLPNGKLPTIEELNACKGPNPNAKAIELVRANGGENLTHDQRSSLAFSIVRSFGKAIAKGAPSSLS